MLVLSRKMYETIHIGNDVVVTVVRTGNGSVRIGIEAPKGVAIVRGELRPQNCGQATEEACATGAVAEG